jgi:hypothetical protein
MTSTLRIEDIEEFEIVKRIPRQAISQEVLEGIKNLNESTEIEPFIREIIADNTNTPHTSTEIADIVTHHLTVKGQPRLTAFINKGKSFSKVNAEKITYQLTKALTIPRLELMILLATGDIQNDAKRDLYQITSNANVSPLIIDCVDIARLFIAHNKVCPKDGSPYKNNKCPKCSHAASEPIIVSLPVYEEPRYEILEHKDSSNVFLKRYSANVITDPHYSKMTVREVIKQVNAQLVTSNYYRSEGIEEALGQREADQVFLFVYTDMKDVQQINWICRTQWMNPKTVDKFPRESFKNAELLGEIQIDWSSNYETMRNLWKARVGTKKEWREKVSKLLPLSEQLAERAKSLLQDFDNGVISQASFSQTMTQLEKEALSVSVQAGNTNWPPLECQECDDRFYSMLISLHNTFINFADWGKNDKTWSDKLWLTRDYLKDYQKKKNDFEYEWKKIK